MAGNLRCQPVRHRTGSKILNSQLPTLMQLFLIHQGHVAPMIWNSFPQSKLIHTSILKGESSRQSAFLDTIFDCTLIQLWFWLWFSGASESVLRSKRTLKIIFIYSFIHSLIKLLLVWLGQAVYSRSIVCFNKMPQLICQPLDRKIFKAIRFYSTLG